LPALLVEFLEIIPISDFLWLEVKLAEIFELVPPIGVGSSLVPLLINYYDYTDIYSLDVISSLASALPLNLYIFSNLYFFFSNILGPSVVIQLSGVFWSIEWKALF
jgi:hypothetical protein